MAAVDEDLALRKKAKTRIQAQKIAKYVSIFPDQSDTTWTKSYQVQVNLILFAPDLNYSF